MGMDFHCLRFPDRGPIWFQWNAKTYRLCFIWHGGMRILRLFSFLHTECDITEYTAAFSVSMPSLICKP